MGQYANQPDFGTEAKEVTLSNDIDNVQHLNRSCLYVGTAGDITCILSGVTAPDGFSRPTAADAVTFKALPAGSFLPVIVDYVLLTGTTAADLVAVK